MMKKLLFLLMAVLATAMTVQAATNYDFEVGGVPVTSNNCNNITSQYLTHGTAVYNPSTKVLTLTDVTINISTVNDHAIFNDDCDGLKIRFVGTCRLTSGNYSCIRLEDNTMIELAEGSNVIINSSSNGIFIKYAKFLQLDGSGTCVITSYGDDAIEGDSGAVQSVQFWGGTYRLQCGSNASVLKHAKFLFYDGYVVLKATNNSSYPVVSCNSISIENGSISAPDGAYASGGSIYDANGNKVYKDDVVYVTSNYYSALLTSSFFPDNNFRAYLRSLYPEGFISKTEMPSLTYLDVSGLGIHDMTGVSKLTELKTLNCYNNSISSLNVNSNTKLQYLNCKNNNLSTLSCNSCTELATLYCYDNYMTSLNLSNLSKLQTISCYNNRLTSITLPTASTSALQTLICGENKFTTLSVYSYPNLVKLSAYSCPQLTTLNCYNNALTTLNVSGDTSLKTLSCRTNSNLASIIGLEDCTAMTFLSCYNCALTDLNSAVSGMTNLETLYCDGNKLTTLNVQNKNKLTRLDCYNNPNLTSASITNNSALVTLNAYNCPSLTTLYCPWNDLTAFDVHGNTAMQKLQCYNNEELATITGLASCTAITYLDCEDCKIADLSAVSGMNDIATLWARNNKLTSLAVTGKSKLTNLRVSGNTLLTTLNCYDNALTSLDVSGCTAMTMLRCYENASLSLISGLADCTALTYLDADDCNFSSLNVSTLTKLKTLRCRNNNLSSLNVSPLTQLQYLYCYDNNLSSLNVSSKTSLKELYCQYNQLTSLNVQGCSSLNRIDCYSNKLTSLYVQGCPALNYVACYKNQISGSGMTTLVGSLPTRSSSDKGSLYAIYNTNEGNSMTAAQITAARNKYWQPKKYNGSNWVDLTASLKGDVNNSGVVDISDVTDLINYLATGNSTGINMTAANVNGDSGVDISDVTALIDYLLHGTW